MSETENPTTTIEPTTPSYPPEWTAKLQPFADEIEKTLDEVTQALKLVVGNPGAKALKAISNEAYATTADIQAVFPDVPKAILLGAIDLLRGPKPVVTAAPSTAVTANSFVPTDVLPSFPEDNSFISMLLVGGVLKPGPTDVVAVAKASLADEIGLYNLPDKIAALMEETADTLTETIPNEFFEVYKLVTQRKNAEVLNALGVPRKLVSDARIRAFQQRFRENFWTSLKNFNTQLLSWREEYRGNMMTPDAIFGAFVAHSNPGMPTAIAPDTSAVRAAADRTINDINQLFGGFGVPIARVLAHDAEEIKKVLENPNLPRLIGALSREQMLVKLGVGLPSEYLIRERNLVKYILAILDLNKQTPGQPEYNYLFAMAQVGASVNFDSLGKKAGAATAGGFHESKPMITGGKPHKQY